MSVSQHPVALSLERAVGGDSALLATVLFLPLIDGVFAALVLAGALETISGVLMVGLLIFGGSATVAVIVADMDGTPQECAWTVLLLGVPLIMGAAIVAAAAPTIESMLTLEVFERFAAIVILAVAAQTASARVRNYLPRPAVIVILGLVASIDPTGAEFALTTEPELVIRGIAAAVIGVGFALAVAIGSSVIRHNVDLDRFRFGSAVSLGLIPLSILGLPFGDYAALGALALTGLFALDPKSSNTPAVGDSEEESAEFDQQSDRTERAPWL